MDGASFVMGDWSGTYMLDGIYGLVLNDIQHHHYNLAKSVQVIRLWLNPENPDAKKRRRLHLGSDFALQGTLTPLSSDQKPPSQFADYPTVFGLQCDLLSNKVDDDELLGSDDADQKIKVRQTYLFTQYGKEPPHEPGGVLDAARLFPLTYFSTNHPKITSVRVDYCLHLSLDVLLDVTGISREELAALLKRPNQCGVFRDIEHLPMVATAFKGFFGATPKTSDFFKAAEKPLQFELVGDGLIKGSSANTWDNMHQWGAADGRKTLPSTPGAFHAAHIHWRWGEIAGSPDPTDKWFTEKGIAKGKIDRPTGVGQKQFIGAKGAGTPLVDPRFPKQTIRFAVTKETLFSTIADDASADFKHPFDSLPANIMRGDDLLFWLSFQVDDDRTSSASGPFAATVFPHGLFFAHNPELAVKPTSGTLGKSSPSGKVRQQWPRNPNDSYYG